MKGHEAATTVNPQPRRNSRAHNPRERACWAEASPTVGTLRGRRALDCCEALPNIGSQPLKVANTLLCSGELGLRIGELRGLLLEGLHALS
jgi:hypothetical protein